MTFQEKIESAIFIYESLRAKENIDFYINEIKRASKDSVNQESVLWLVERLEEVKEA